MTTYTKEILNTNSITKTELAETFERSGKILTDLLEQVLVGELEDQVLIYSPFVDNGFTKSTLATNTYTKQSI